jgi:hypothetical protein
MSEPEDILNGYIRASHELEAWLKAASAEDLRLKSAGTRWTNEELLFHMVFGFMVVRALLPLVRVMSRLPKRVRRAFAAALNAGTTPFDFINYWGSRSAATVFNRHRMGKQMGRTIDALSRNLQRESTQSLARSMHFPDRWDPFFEPVMTLRDVYAYPTLHFDFHARQLSLPPRDQRRPE